MKISYFHLLNFLWVFSWIFSFSKAKIPVISLNNRRMVPNYSFNEHSFNLRTCCKAQYRHQIISPFMLANIIM